VHEFFLAITQPFLGQIASSWARWKEDIELFQMKIKIGAKFAASWRKMGVSRHIFAVS
jgi:hypothetical protein